MAKKKNPAAGRHPADGAEESQSVAKHPDSRPLISEKKGSGRDFSGGSERPSATELTEAPLILHVDPADLADALGGELLDDNQIACPGPGHSAGDFSLSIMINPDAADGFVVNSFANKEDWRAGRELVYAALRGLPKGERRVYSERPRIPPEKKPSFLWAQRMWNERGGSASHSIIETYLAARGLRLPPNGDNIFRLLERSPTGGPPAMMARIQDVEGRLTGFHFTFLRADGAWKAPVEPGRKCYGVIAGGAIHLAPAAKQLLVAEGIESALTAMLVDRTRRPAWAAISAGNMAKLALPDVVRNVVILPDGDEAGTSLRAAEEAAQRWQREGREVRIGAAPVRAGFKGTDLNDLHMERLGLRRPVFAPEEPM
jgi:hypothetical protein